MDYTESQILNFSNQLVYKILNSKINNYPFFHCETKNILPKKLFDLTIINFPKQDEFISHTSSDAVIIDKKDKSSSHPYDFRNQIFLTRPDDMSRIKSPRYAFWEFFMKILCSPIVIKSFLKLYKNQVKQRFGDNLKNISFYPNIMLLHDKANYSLGPHTDIEHKVLSALIYLSSDKENSDSYGTSIYVPKTENFVCDGKKHHEHKDFYKIYTAEFINNNSFSFFRTNNSFHGVETVPNKPIERKLLQYSIVSKDNSL